MISFCSVAPLVGAWIEIIADSSFIFWIIVAPLVGAWIEILYFQNESRKKMSLLSWERGLKFCCCHWCRGVNHVAPLVGAWIEITNFAAHSDSSPVAPLVGAWIEILSFSLLFLRASVAPLVGAWIEMQMPYTSVHRLSGRSSRGSVD